MDNVPAGNAGLDSIPAGARKGQRKKSFIGIIACLLAIGTATYGIDSLLVARREGHRMALQRMVEEANPHVYLLGPPGKASPGDPKVLVMRPPFAEADPGKALEASLSAQGETSPNLDGQGNPKLAPDFNLDNVITAEKVQLSRFRWKMPVVLIFGSFG